MKLNLDGQCRGYRIREDGNLAAEITDVWRMRHSSVSVKMSQANLSVKLDQ
ncbi:hypothetical protein D3C79_948060 [compost metagenome]